jgi:hypothetical protein
MTLKRIVACLALLGVCGCSQLRPACDAKGSISTLRQLVAGLPDEPSPQAKAWLEKTIDIIVMKETPDASGRHVGCVSRVTISRDEITTNKQPGFKFALSVATGQENSATIHYTMNFGAFSLTPTSTVLTPASDTETTQIQLFRLVLQPTLIGLAQEKSQEGSNSLLASVAPRNSNDREMAISIDGSYHRSKPAGDLVITQEGNAWRVSITAASPADNPEMAAADCHLQGVGTLNGTRLSAKVVPFKLEGDDVDVSAEDVKELAPMSITIGADSITVDTADFGSVCGTNSDLTGLYKKVSGGGHG